MQTIIDSHAGPCPGVRRALNMLELELHQGRCVALGSVIHNPVEVARLERSGLETVPQEQVEAGDLRKVRGRRVFIRSHGISEKLRQTLEQAGAEIIDGVCPTVSALQRNIRRFYQQGYQILIIGKHGHPEVKGLCGAADDRAVVIASEADFAAVDPAVKSLLVAQTTVDEQVFQTMADRLREHIGDLKVLNTLCRQVTGRQATIREFAARVDVLLLVGGKNSSNTKVLFTTAQSVNRRSHWIEHPDELREQWFTPNDTVGITGSASTPMLQLADMQRAVEALDAQLMTASSHFEESPLRGTCQ